MLTWISFDKTEGKSVGIPIPRFIFIPSLTYWAALLIIFNFNFDNLSFSAASYGEIALTYYWFFFAFEAGSYLPIYLAFLSVVNFYIFFSDHLQLGSLLNILFTYTAGTCTCYGSIWSTIYYTYAITSFAAVAISALKLFAALLKYKLPNLSAFYALIKATSPKIDYY